jgi:hypothetical protein
MKPYFAFPLMLVVPWPVYALSDWLGLPFLLTSVVTFFAINRSLMAYNSRDAEAEAHPRARV